MRMICLHDPTSKTSASAMRHTAVPRKEQLQPVQGAAENRVLLMKPWLLFSSAARNERKRFGTGQPCGQRAGPLGLYPDRHGPQTKCREETEHR